MEIKALSLFGGGGKRMEKMERKKTVLLTLIDDWEKLCKKSLS